MIAQPPEVQVLIPGLELIPVAAAITDCAGVFRWANERFSQITGYALDDLAGQQASLLASEDVWRESASGQPWKGESIGRWKDGNLCDIQLAVTPVREVAGAVTHLLWSFKDISTRKAALARVEQSRKVALAAEALAKFESFKWLLKAAIVLRTDQAEPGADSGEESTCSSFDAWFRTVYLDDRERILTEVRRAIESPEGRLNIEYRVGGGTQWFSCSGQLYCDAAGAPDHISGIHVEITQQKLAELALRHQADFAQRVFNSTDDHLAVVDADGRILEVNDAWRRFARENGAGDESTWGRGAIYHGKHPPGEGNCAEANAAYEGLRQVQARILPLFELEHSCDSPDEKRWFVMRVLPFLGQPGTVLVSHSDITRRRRAEQALRESEERYRGVSSVISDVAYGCLTTESGGHVLDWLTGATERITGYSVDELKAMGSWGAIVIPEDRPQFNRYVLALEPGSSGFCELRVHHKDGSFRWLASSAECFDSPRRIYGGLVDITVRKTVEKALVDSEWLLRESQIIAGLGSYVLDITTRVWKSSDVLDMIFGIDESFVRNIEAWAALIHPEDRPMIIDYFREEVVGRGRKFDKEYRILRRNTGEERWVHGLGHLEFDAGGQPLAMHGTIQDITERRRVEAALRESETRYRTIFESSRDALFIADGRTGMVVDANSAAQALIARDLETIRTMHQTQLHPPEDVSVSRANFERDRVQPTINLHSVIRSDGKKIPVEIVATRLPDDAGQELLLGAFRDVTERTRAEEEREKLTSQLAHAQKMESVGRLAGGVAHDFNNLLTVINGHCQLLLTTMRSGDPVRASIETILKAGERAEALTQQLLAFSRKQMLQPQVLDLNRVVSDMRSMMSRLVGEDVHVRVELGARNSWVSADPHQLQQVLMNLIVNARDAMPHGGSLSIETCDAASDPLSPEQDAQGLGRRHVRLTVSDSGTGMDEDTRRKIFEPFYTTKGIGKGTGLGLSMVHGIVAQSGGVIEVDSLPGRGSTFHIYLPLAESAAPAIAAPAPAPSLRGTETVLVVEDQPEVLSFTVRVLKTFGYQVVEARDAKQALAVFRENPARIGLVLTDVVMPGGSGRELADALELLHPGIKVIFMSGYTEDVIVRHFAGDEDRHFLQKPFSPSQLAAKVKAALGT